MGYKILDTKEGKKQLINLLKKANIREIIYEPIYHESYDNERIPIGYTISITVFNEKKKRIRRKI